MNKNFTTLTLFFLLAQLSFGQFIIEHNSAPGVNLEGTTFTYPIPNGGVDEVTVNFKIENLTGQTIHVKCRTTEISGCAGACTGTNWILCQDPWCYISGEMDTWSSIYGDEITNGDTALHQVHYQGNGDDCCALYLYEWVDVNDTNLVVGSFYIRYDHTTLNACTVGTEELTTQNSFEVYPNPAINEIYLSTEETSTIPVNVVLYNMYGEVVLFNSFNLNSTVLDTSTLPAGIYFLHLSSNGKTLQSERVVITH